MPATPMNSVLGQLRRITLHPLGGDLTDGQLLESFYDRREEGAFQALVRRHGSMVFGVCRRILHNTHDAEDAFQAVFLVLARKGHGFLKRETIGNWLYGVAYHTALKARAETMRRRTKEYQVKPRTEAADEDALQELQPLLDQELSRLADKYREPVVLCELQGMPRKDAARQLGISEGTLSSRLATARRMLAKRLGRHIPALSIATLTTLFSGNAASASAPPAALVASTAHAAGIFSTGQATAGAISAHVVALSEGVLKTMFLTKIKLATAVLLLVGFLGIGLSTLAISAQSPAVIAVKDAKQPGKEDKKNEGKKDEPKKVDPKEKQDPKTAEDRVIDSIEDSVTLEGKVKKLTIKSITGIAVVDCGNLEAEEIEIVSMSGGAKASLKLAKGKLKKLVIGTVQGVGQLDCSMLEVDAIEVKDVNGGGKLNLTAKGNISIGSLNGVGQLEVKAKGNVTIGSMSGGAKANVSECRDFIVEKGISGVASVEARYHGTAKCEGTMTTSIKLTKIESPK